MGYGAQGQFTPDAEGNYHTGYPFFDQHYKNMDARQKIIDADPRVAQLIASGGSGTVNKIPGLQDTDVKIVNGKITHVASGGVWKPVILAGAVAGTAGVAGSAMGPASVPAATAPAATAPAVAPAVAKASMVPTIARTAAAVTPAALSLMGGKFGGGSGNGGTDEISRLMQQFPQLKEMLDLQTNQARRQDPLHEALTTLGMKLMSSNAAPDVGDVPSYGPIRPHTLPR